MAFPFSLPTTSILTFGACLRCDSHPSLPLEASTRRLVVRSALKCNRVLFAEGVYTGLGALKDALLDYLPYLLALDSGLSGKTVSGEEVHVTLEREIEVEWRSSIAATAPGRRVPRSRGKGLDYELLFVLVTIGYVTLLSARSQFIRLHTLSLDQKKVGLNEIMKKLLTAESHFSRALALSTSLPASSLPAGAIDIHPQTLIALSSLCLAQATLLAVARDDPYPSLAARARDDSDKEWMYKAPDMPKVRAHVFARLCLAAADHAAKAFTMFSSRRSHGTDVASVREDLVKLTRDVQRTARGRACRFIGIDAELGGKVGEGLGWLNAGKREVGLPVARGFALDKDGGGSKFKPSLTKLKSQWSERQERRNVDGKANGSRAGDASGIDDAGKTEEGRVLDMLEKNWSKVNDLISHQIVPDEKQLMESMPSGREVHTPRSLEGPVLAEDMLERLRAPPERDEERDGSDDSVDEIEGEGLPGSFPDAPSRNATGQATYY